MIEICGCVPFIYDHLVSHHDKLRPCEIDGLICIQDNSKKISIIKDVDMPNMTCSCRTPCEDVIYEGFPNSVPLIKPELAISYKNMTDNDSILRVFMQTQVFPTTETLAAADEVYLLASIGGIFSLFLGCSFLSLVEILYFISLFCRAAYSRRKLGPAKDEQARASRREHRNGQRNVY
ncbi:sodium channel protein Nach isoform X1 [Nomia melanderi]|uniref:sodium channel protein Nach isoform X1 n=1 Tax=Nomia melanderi TaxID=2448451 RepID=UPI003FCC7A94